MKISQRSQHMARPITYHLLATLVLLVLYPNAESQWVPRRPLPPVTLPPVNLPPLCTSQLALANRACAVLPYTPVPPPSPPSPPSPDTPPSPDGSDSRHHHRHHGHGHSGDRETQTQEECCRWVKEVDDVCVCGLLVHLQPFLTRPAHNYTVIVDDSCSITFACGSRLVPI